jgi:hypothetical protein
VTKIGATSHDNPFLKHYNPKLYLKIFYYFHGPQQAHQREADQVQTVLLGTSELAGFLSDNKL